MNPHEILGIPPGATEKEIKTAYKILAKKYHPDLNGGDKEAEAKFKEINAAYTMLTEKPKQDEAPDFGFGPDVNLHDLFSHAIFDQIFRGGASRTINRAPVDPEVLILGGTFPYTIQVVEQRNGRIRPVQKTVQITIEPDTPVGTRIAVPDTHPHHIFLELVPVDTNKYRIVEGVHLCENRTIDAFEAMCGSSIEVAAPGGKKISVKIPPGTQHGSIHRVGGMGLKHPNGKRGDYLVQFLVSIPRIRDEDDLKTRYATLKNLEGQQP